MNSNTELLRKSKALKKANKKINIAMSMLNKGKESDELLFETLVEYLADKFNQSSSGISLKIIENILETKNIDKQIFNEIKTIWEELDFIRFAPSLTNIENIKNLCLKMEKLIKEWDKKI